MVIFVTFQVLYAAPVWAKAATTPLDMSGLARAHRLCANRIICAFRKISEEAALVIGGLVPIQELVRAAAEVKATVTSTDDQCARIDGPREKDQSLGGRRDGIP